MVDQAGWHLSTRLVVPANITIIPLPPKCPELNPVENVWQFMRDNWLSNRIFKSYDDLVDHCCAAWNKLVVQPWRIMSIGLRQLPIEWALLAGPGGGKRYSTRLQPDHWGVQLFEFVANGEPKPREVQILRNSTPAGCLNA